VIERVDQRQFVMELGDGDHSMWWLARVSDDDDRDAGVVAVASGGEQRRQPDGAEEVDPREVHHDPSYPRCSGCHPQRLIQQGGGGEVDRADGVHDNLVADRRALHAQQLAAHLCPPTHQHRHPHSGWLLNRVRPVHCSREKPHVHRFVIDLTGYPSTVVLQRQPADVEMAMPAAGPLRTRARLFLLGGGVIYLVLWPYGPAQRARQRCYFVPGQHRRPETALAPGLAS
jgi:hypothetical protein